ncbi:hypothetical protein BDP27DRAFT_1334301, partial [Rhodocollybia butyracea]
MPGSIQILLTFWCLSASFLATISAPLIPVNNELERTIEKRQTFERRTDSEPAHRAQLIKVPVHLWIEGKGSPSEHWSLIIDHKNGFGAQMAHAPSHEPLGKESPLIPIGFVYRLEKTSKLENLGCTASFETKEEMNHVFSQLVEIQMTKKPRQVGGNCMDYVKKALSVLKEGDHIPKIPPRFTRIYRNNYKSVRKKVWGT